MAGNRSYKGELSTDVCRAVIDSIAAFASPMLILTGGEPMTRPDLPELTRHATQRGLRVVMATCGHLLDDHNAKELQQAGVRTIGVSIDGASPEAHDAFRGVTGAFERTVAGIRHARAAGIPIQVNTTVTRHNVDDLPALLDLAVSLDAKTFDLFFLVPTGRAAALVNQELSPTQCERTFRWINQAAANAPLRIKTTCAPHFVRVAGRGTPEGASAPVAPGCMAGRGFVFISHTGILQPCGFLDVPAGNLADTGWDFKAAYRSSRVFADLRDLTAYEGKCGTCEFLARCGGCRARAYAHGGSYLGEEPSCLYRPPSTEHAP